MSPRKLSADRLCAAREWPGRSSVSAGPPCGTITKRGKCEQEEDLEMSDSRATEGLLGGADRLLRPAASSLRRSPVPFKLHRAHRTGRGFVQPTSFRTALLAEA